ncbi:KLHL8 [Symbiodinium sp. CCMP2456]|nr:KLHL8 [Symbiodinium sp. CCMP2456]
MCSKTSLEAVLAEQRSNLNGLITQTQQLEVQQDKLAEDARHTSSLLRDLRREHRELLKDFTQLREEFCAVRDCLTAANVVTKPAVNRNLSRRRAPMVLKKVLEEPGLSLTFGSIAGVVGCLRVRETSKGLCGGISTCLPLLRKRMPPEIYVLGGKNDSSPALATAECFSPLHGEWRSLPPMAARRYGCAAATVNGLLYVVGGHDGHKVLASAERFDPTKGSWSRLPDMPTPRSRCAAVSMRGCLHVLGGRTCDGRPNAALPTERFDPARGVWQVLPASPLAHLGCAAAEVSGSIYAVGVSADRSMIVERFDPTSGSWSTLSAQPRHRFGVAAAAVAGALYVVGGHNGQKAVAELERCELRSGAKARWDSLPPAPTPRHGAAATAAAGALYIVGGDDGQSLASVERFDTAAKQWCRLPPLPTGRFGCAAAAAWR